MQQVQSENFQQQPKNGERKDITGLECAKHNSNFSNTFYICLHSKKQ